MRQNLAPGSSGDERETILTVASIWWPEGKAQLEILLLKKGGGLGKFSVILIVSNLGVILPCFLSVGQEN